MIQFDAQEIQQMIDTLRQTRRELEDLQGDLQELSIDFELGEDWLGEASENFQYNLRGPMSRALDKLAEKCEEQARDLENFLDDTMRNYPNLQV